MLKAVACSVAVLATGSLSALSPMSQSRQGWLGQPFLSPTGSPIVVLDFGNCESLRESLGTNDMSMQGFDVNGKALPFIST